jgi:hypothetical protein
MVKMSQPETVVPFPAPPPEFEYLLDGITEERQRKAITDAFYRTAQGDPESFPVAFATITKALLVQQQRLAERTATLVQLAEAAGTIITGANDFATGVESVKREVDKLLNLQAGTILAAMGVSAMGGILVTFLLLLWTGHLR